MHHIRRWRSAPVAILLLMSLAATERKADSYGDTLQVVLPVAALGRSVLGGVTQTSRIEAGAHDIWQVLAGAVWTVIVEGALRRAGSMRERAASVLRLGARRLPPQGGTGTA